MSLGTYGKIGVAGGVVALVGALLPWWNVSASAGPLSVSLPVLGIFTPGGILAAVCGVLGIVFATRQRNVAMGVLTSVMGVIALVGAVVWGVMMPTASVAAGGASASVTAGFGYWITLIGGLLLLVAGVMSIGAARSAPGPVPTN